MDIPRVLVKLGLANHEWGPETDTYEHLVKGWRGGVPLPPEEDFDEAWAEIQAEDTPEARREAEVAQYLANDEVLASILETVAEHQGRTMTELTTAVKAKHREKPFPVPEPRARPFDPMMTRST